MLPAYDPDAGCRWLFHSMINYIALFVFLLKYSILFLFSINVSKMKPFLRILLLFAYFSPPITAQDQRKPLTYYLPNIQYNPAIPRPEDYLGFQIGEWHVSHDQIIGYFQALDAASDRIELVKYGKTHENRQLFVAMISSPENLKNKDKIKQQHAALSNATTATAVDIKNLPLVLWQGYSIHGNEASGNNAALLVAYYLAAGLSDEVNATLNNTFILLDPCLNPDGVQRFSTWVNSHKSHTLVSDPASREFSEVWPGGRYNHYWFDMNRDWLLLVHPESRGRVSLLHEWHPNVLTDHHEMGTNSTFFFHPGAPASNNPNTPEENFQLTEELGKFHAKALDSIGSLYYTKYNFDDFYYGKGSTYPDAIGAIGILFEQGSSRGHIQESINGPVTFPFTIRNQVNTSLSTQRGAVALKGRILSFKQKFHQQLLAKAATNPVKGYVFTSSDKNRLYGFLNILKQHHVDVYTVANQMQLNGKVYPVQQSFIVPLSQAQSILAKTIFEKVTTFKDSSFYDVSGWTLPIAYGLQFDALTQMELKEKQKLTEFPECQGLVNGKTREAYAYLISSEQSNMYAGIYQLQKEGIRVRCSQADVTLTENGVARMYKKGTAVIQVSGQALDADALAAKMHELANQCKLTIDATSSGNSTELVTLGHPLVQPIMKPSVFVMAGPGIQPQSAGEVWHHFDKELNIPATLMEPGKVRSTQLNRYNTLVLPEGSYNGWSENEVAKLREWVMQGNTIIGLGSACQWLAGKNLIALTPRKENKKGNGTGFYENAERELDAKVVAGSIFQTDADLSHPLHFGLDQPKMAIMKTSNKVYEPTTNPYATPAKYASSFLLSGYLPKGSESNFINGASTTVHGIGSGKIICFHDNPLFRGYWKIGQRMFDNAVFLSSIIESKTIDTGN